MTVYPNTEFQAVLTLSDGRVIRLPIRATSRFEASLIAEESFKRTWIPCSPFLARASAIPAHLPERKSTLP